MQLTLTGCGDLFGKKVAEKPMGGTRLKANCELDLDDLADILDRPITSTLNCLEKNLEIFMDVSELGRGGKLSRPSLINYLKRNKPDIDQHTYAAINAVFDLSHLITGEEKDFISRKNVGLIVELVRKFNIQAARHYQYTFGSKDPANLFVHESHRKRVEEGAVEIQKAIEEIYVANRGEQTHVLNIMELVGGFIKAENEATLDKIEGMLFVKKIIVGGDTATINHKELGFLFGHLPKLLSLVLDGVRYQHLKLTQPEVMTFLKDDVSDLANILFHPVRGDRRFEPLFDMNVAIDGIDRFIKEDDEKIGKYRVLIKEVKYILTKDRNTNPTPEEEWVTGRDLEKVFNHVFNVTSKSLVFTKFYNHPEINSLLESPQSVYLDPKKYELDFPQDKAELVDFCRIINTYRYMKGSFEMATYSLDYKRNADAPAEIAMYEYAIKRAFSYFGSGGLSMGVDQLKMIMKKFENELIEMNIILPRRSGNTSETISLLGSLFQAQSDDNKVLDVDEATEFAISLVSAMDAQHKLYDFYADKNCKVDEFDRLDAACFKEHFYEAICTNYRSNFPRLFEYLGADPKLGCDKQNFNSDHNMNYLNASAVAARFCHIYPDQQSEIEYSKGDMMSIILEMMHIETTITRWDKNLNNTMDPDDVMDAFSIYKPAIGGMLPDAVKKFPPKVQDYVTKVVFQYLVKFEDTPKFEGKDLWKTIANLGKLIVKKAPADRKTIASILRIVSEESKKKAQAAYEANPNDPSVEKPFDCNWLHDPRNIPRD